DDDPGVGHVVERMTNGTSGIARGRDENRGWRAAIVKRGDQARHHARANVLERQRWAMKELEGVNPGLQFDERYLKIQGLANDRGERLVVDLAGRVWPENAHAQLEQGTRRKLRKLFRTPTIDLLWHIQAAVGREAVEQSPLERGRRCLAACSYEAHAETTCAP